MSEHVVWLSRAEVVALRAWLDHPNGAHGVRWPEKDVSDFLRGTRVVFEAVEGGGLLVRTQRRAEVVESTPEAEPPHEIVDSRDSGHRLFCRCGEKIELRVSPRTEKVLEATQHLARLHVERGNAAAEKIREIDERESRKTAERTPRW